MKIKYISEPHTILPKSNTSCMRYHPTQTQAKEKRKLYAEAWSAVEKANKYIRSVTEYDVDKDLKTLDVLLNVFKRQFTFFTLLLSLPLIPSIRTTPWTA